MLLPRSRRSNCIDYFDEARRPRLGNNTGSQSSEQTDKFTIDDLIKDMSQLTINNRLRGPLNAKLLGARRTQVSLSQKHMRVYGARKGDIWLGDIPIYSEEKILRSVSEGARASTFDMLLRIFISNRLSRHAYFRTLMLFDAYAQIIDKPVPDEEVELWGFAAMFLALKYEVETMRISLKQLSALCENKFSEAQLALAENALFQRLHYRVGFPTYLHVLDEIMFRCGIVFDSGRKIRVAAEAVLLRCVVTPHMLRTRAQLLCSSVLLYTIYLFFDTYKQHMRQQERPFNKHKLEATKGEFKDAIGKAVQINKEMLESVRIQIKDMCEEFDSNISYGRLAHIESIADLSDAQLG